ncbi:TPA: molecular chaperone [Serratia marcescens]|uniref:Molecular chaperone n=3 Tax=Serratia TaxID=613 RepID=A0A9X9BXJ4_9GAMM|nr:MULTISPECIES: molecular chaperone [Serratia]MBS3894517.1 molecular chaperone [Serratia marcescens]TXE22529.1 molecular chaperone [Serratia ureilytica]HBC7422441.1 molecular chaperone [Serratia marcescens]
MIKYLRGLFFLLAAGGPTVSYALSLDSTRLILPQQKREVVYQAINSEEGRAYLVSVQLTKTPNGHEVVPNFVVSPQLFRLNPNSNNAIRVRLVSIAGLPVDRESVFYVMTAGLPSSPTPFKGAGEGGGYSTRGAVSASVGFLIKLFYRPIALDAPTRKTFQQVLFTRVPGGVKLANPTPYYLALKGISIDGHRVNFSKTQPDLVPPFGEQIYGTVSTLKKSVNYRLINDFGAVMSYDTTIH